jgi:hypothetical protein
MPFPQPLYIRSVSVPQHQLKDQSHGGLIGWERWVLGIAGGIAVVGAGLEAVSGRAPAEQPTAVVLLIIAALFIYLAASGQSIERIGPKGTTFSTRRQLVSDTDLREIQKSLEQNPPDISGPSSDDDLLPSPQELRQITLNQSPRTLAAFPSAAIPLRIVSALGASRSWQQEADNRRYRLEHLVWGARLEGRGNSPWYVHLTNGSTWRVYVGRAGVDAPIVDKLPMTPD